MIELDNITKVYKAGQTEVPALRAVSCHIKSGEMISITGPSGSGKSTLMDILGKAGGTTALANIDGIALMRRNPIEDEAAARPRRSVSPRASCAHWARARRPSRAATPVASARWTCSTTRRRTR